VLFLDRHAKAEFPLDQLRQSPADEPAPANIRSRNGNLHLAAKGTFLGDRLDLTGTRQEISEHETGCTATI
jgi:hypothetical protein